MLGSKYIQKRWSQYASMAPPMTYRVRQ